jgi:uncharacterized membrane protein
MGLLYKNNRGQVPALAVAARDQGGPGPAAITKYVAPRALWWFRWGAVVTWLSGAALLAHRGMFLDAFTLGQMMDNPNVYVVAIGMGAWLGTIMLINVWGLIWRNQKKVLGIVAATDEEKNKAKRIAFLASRTNVMLSIGMLLFMGAAHGVLF